MKNKYVMINGLAFNEEHDLEKLNIYASQGWILEGIVGGFFYKLRKDEPQNIVYNLDYQTDTNEEYFTMFKEAGWKLVISVENYIHIFSAQAGTKPIYSDCESKIDKYTSARDRMKKGSIYSLILAIVLMGLVALSPAATKSISLIIFGLLIIDICVFVFNFMPYLAYNTRIKQIEKHGKCNSEAIANKNPWKLEALAGIIWLAIGVWHLTGKLYFSAVFFIVFGSIFIFSSLAHFKKYKKYL